MHRVDVGDEVRDRVTGFSGIAVGRTIFLAGCTRVGVQAKAAKDGTVRDAQWFDEPQLEVIKRGKVVLEDQRRHLGGPMPSIPTRNKSG